MPSSRTKRRASSPIVKPWRAAAGRARRTRERRVGQIALDAVAAERIGTIEHDHADARPRALPHGQRQRPHEGVVAGPDVLEVDDEGVEPGQCLRVGARRSPYRLQTSRPVT